MSTAPSAPKLTASKRNEDLVVGDMVRLWFGWVRIVAIRPYTGPLTDIVFAIADYVGSGQGVNGFSLEIGGYTEVAA